MVRVACSRIRVCTMACGTPPSLSLHLSPPLPPPPQPSLPPTLFLSLSQPPLTPSLLPITSSRLPSPLHPFLLPPPSPWLPLPLFSWKKWEEKGGARGRYVPRVIQDLTRCPAKNLRRGSCWADGRGRGSAAPELSKAAVLYCQGWGRSIPCHRAVAPHFAPSLSPFF
jgi:hypothetical protein